MKKLIFLLLIFILYGCQEAEPPQEKYNSKLFWDNLKRLKAQEPNTLNTPYKFDFDAIEVENLLAEFRQFAGYKAATSADKELLESILLYALQKPQQPVPHYYFDNSTFQNQIYRQEQLRLMQQLVEQQKQLVEQQQHFDVDTWLWRQQQQMDAGALQLELFMMRCEQENNAVKPFVYPYQPVFKPKMWWEY